MSAGLTIEQVLARSLRMPRRRLAAQSAIAKTMDRAEATARHNHQQQQHAAAPTPLAGLASALMSGGVGAGANALPTPNSSEEALSSQQQSVNSEHAATIQPPQQSSATTAKQQQPVSMPSASGSKHHQRFNVPIPKEEPDPYPDRPLLRRMVGGGGGPGGGYGMLARNCDDLLSHLTACKQLGDWRDALTVFAQHTARGKQIIHAMKTLEEKAAANGDANSKAPSATGSSPPSSSSSSSKPAAGIPLSMTVSKAHIAALVETLVAADKAQLLEEMVLNGHFDDNTVNDVEVVGDGAQASSGGGTSSSSGNGNTRRNRYAQGDVVLRCTATALTRRNKWKEAIHVLSLLRSRAYAPIEAYNEIIAACEASGAWEDAMHIVFDLKDKHDGFIDALSAYERAKAEFEAENGVVVGGDDTVDVSSASSPLVSSSSSSSGEGSAAGAAFHLERPIQKYPRPDAVTWTTLISALEKSGQSAFAQEVLRVAPDAERETILASYTALIYTWSMQRKKKF